MRRSAITALVGVAVLLLAGVSAAHAQGAWDRYKPGSLHDVEEAGLEELATFLSPDGPRTALSGHDHPTRARVVYTGESRGMTAGAAELIGLWVRAFGHAAETESLFQKELLFREDGRAFWLPVQEPLVAHLETLEPGSPVMLYVIWLGARRESGGQFVGLFVVNEFDEGASR
jgi:hypothetical protein